MIVLPRRYATPVAALGVSMAGGPGGPTTGAHRYWRINITASQSAASVNELEFWLDGTTKHTITGGTEIASANGAGSVIAEAFDGDLTGNSWWSSGGATGWVGYDFGSGNDKEVSMVAVMGRHTSATQYPTSFDVDYSDDGSNWTTAWSCNSLGTWLGNSKMKYFTDPNGGYLHWRLRFTTDAFGAVRLSEFEKRETISGANVTATVIARVTSTDTVGTVSVMLDGDPSTVWASNVFPATITTWFTVEQEIAEVMLRATNGSNISQSPDELYVDTSPDGANWTQVFGQTGFAVWSAGEIRTYTI